MNNAIASKPKVIEFGKKNVAKLPNSVGVYIFKKYSEILYIGKSVSLKSRIQSHIENAKIDTKEAAIVENSNRIEYYIADSEFKSLLLESALIQKFHPKYNRRWQDDKSYLYIKITVKDEFPKVSVVRRENDGKSEYYGPFPSQRDVEEILRSIRRFFPFCTQKKISKRPCFYSKIALCDPCPSEISHIQDKRMYLGLKKIYRHHVRQVRNVLSGKIELVLKENYSRMKELSSEQKYEEALSLRNKINRFEQLIHQKQFTNDILQNYNQSDAAIEVLRKMLKKYFSSVNTLARIECFDVSNLHFSEATASMVVFTNGLPDKSEYKRFKIKNKKLQSDFDMLEEVFLRRFKHNWKKPDLLVVDGGTPQVLKVKRILKNLSNNTPLIGIAKHPDRIVIGTPEKMLTFRPQTNNLGFNLVRLLRDEAHRFARKYHLLLRRKGLMI